MRAGPVVLLADSQLLLNTSKGKLLSQWVKQCLMERVYEERERRALYLGAANGNIDDFYQMAVTICTGWNITSVTNGVVPEVFVEQSPDDFDLVILAGGDVGIGWQFLSQHTVRAWLEYFTQGEGLIIGISAGAIHLASTVEVNTITEREFLAFVSAHVAVHEEQLSWPTRQVWAGIASGSSRADMYCIPFGGGVAIKNGIHQPLGKGVETFTGEL